MNSTNGFSRRCWPSPCTFRHNSPSQSSFQATCSLLVAVRFAVPLFELATSARWCRHKTFITVLRLERKIYCSKKQISVGSVIVRKFQREAMSRRDERLHRASCGGKCSRNYFWQSSKFITKPPKLVALSFPRRFRNLQWKTEFSK